MDAINSPQRSWRDVIRIHPAAAMFPLLAPDQLDELADDIRKNGLRQQVIVFRNEDGLLVLIDGRNRLDALEQLGLPILTPDGGATTLFREVTVRNGSATSAPDET